MSRNVVQEVVSTEMLWVRLYRAEDRTLEQVALERAVAEALTRLKPRERQVIELYYGFEGPRMTGEQIGKQMGVSRARIMQLRDTALRRLRHPRIGEAIHAVVGYTPLPPPRPPSRHALAPRYVPVKQREALDDRRYAPLARPLAELLDLRPNYAALGHSLDYRGIVDGIAIEYCRNCGLETGRLWEGRYMCGDPRA